MARRDQPYFPLFVNDFLTDENLNMCSAESTGVYIRLLCIMHKSKDYGKLLLRQKFQQKERQISNFADMLAKQMPYDSDTIERSLSELLDENVLFIDGDYLCQKRMIKDGNLSETRAKAGRRGAESTNNRISEHEVFADNFAAAKQAANTENENENEYEYENEIEKKEKNDIVSIPFSGELGTAFAEWMSYKAEKGQKYKPQGLKSLITQVEKYARQFGTDATANAIRDSMANNYQGIVFDRIGKGSGAAQGGKKKTTTFYDVAEQMKEGKHDDV